MKLTKREVVQYLADEVRRVRPAYKVAVNLRDGIIVWKEPVWSRDRKKFGFSVIPKGGGCYKIRQDIANSSNFGTDFTDYAGTCRCELGIP